MSAPKFSQRNFFWLLFGAAALLLIVPTIQRVFIDPGTTPPTVPVDTIVPTSTTPPSGCGTNPWFFARDTVGNQFGPAAPEDAANVQATVADFAARRIVDPALQVADSEHLFNEFSDPATRVTKTRALLADTAAWCVSELRFATRLSEATKVEIVEMSGTYQTMDMVDTDRVIPEIYQLQVEKGPFKVLRFTFADGSTKQFKLNCGYQPVQQESFPGVPGTAPAPAPTQPATPAAPSKPGHPQPTPSTTVPGKPGKCSGQKGAYCGTPDSGPELDPVQSNPQPATPGYVPGNAEAVVGQQNADAAATKAGVDPYRPTTYGTPGTGTGSGVTTPSGQTSGPSGNTTGGTAGASNPDSNTGAAGQTSNGTVAPPP